MLLELPYSTMNVTRNFLLLNNSFVPEGPTSEKCSCLTLDQVVHIPALAKVLCVCVIGRAMQDTLLSQCLFPPMCINGYQ